MSDQYPPNPYDPGNLYGPPSGQQPPQPPTQPSYGYGQPPPTYGQYQGGYLPTQEAQGATTAMVLGIVALAGGFICGLPILLGPFAMVMGRNAQKRVDQSNGQLTGRSQATAGFVCGLIATILLALGIAFIVFLVVLGATAQP